MGGYQNFLAVSRGVSYENKSQIRMGCSSRRMQIANWSEAMAREDDQLSLFEPPRREESPPKDESEVQFSQRFIDSKEADYLFGSLRELNGWRQDFIRIFGKAQPLPRLHRWFADSEQSYRWSGIEMNPEPFPDYLREILARLWERTGIQFDTALGNLYRDGKDSIRFHRDDEKVFGDNPTVTMLTFGAERELKFKRPDNRALDTSYVIKSGSLFMMMGSVQKKYFHGIERNLDIKEGRYSVTFREHKN